MGIHNRPGEWLRLDPYIDGFNYAHTHDTPLCRKCLKLRAIEGLDVIRWLQGYQDSRIAQGWDEPVDWRGSECSCGNS